MFGSASRAASAACMVDGHAYSLLIALAIGEPMHENICIDGKSDAGIGLRVSPKMVMVLPSRGLR